MSILCLHESQGLASERPVDVPLVLFTRDTRRNNLNDDDDDNNIHRRMTILLSHSTRARVRPHQNGVRRRHACVALLLLLFAVTDRPRGTELGPGRSSFVRPERDARRFCSN